jgi:hypothetical protein
MYCRDTGDVATGHLAGLSLKTYYTGKTKITDRSLGILGRMRSLERLEFGKRRAPPMPASPRWPVCRDSRRFRWGSPNVTSAGMTVFPPTVRVNYP